MLGCGDDPVEIDKRVWCVEQTARALYSLPLDRPECESHGYLSDVLGPLAFDGEERLLAVDLLQRELVELQPANGYAAPLFALDPALDALALCVAPGERLYLLDAAGRLLQLERESGAWTRTWPIHPEGGWAGLAWLPEVVESANGDVLPEGTLLAWRTVGTGGELCWLELQEQEALAHVLFATPALTGLDTSRRLAAIYGLDAASGDLYRLRPDLRVAQLEQSYACDPFQTGDIALP